jgi:acetyl-CoA C-acetyltransferase
VQFIAILDATRKALKSAGLGVDDIGLFKLYESFAGVLLIAQGSSASPDDKLNINGGSTAIGHPPRSTGADAH